MPTKYELARTEALEQRRQMRRRELWLWRRRMLTWMLLGVATLAALISIIIGIAVPVEELEAAGNPVSGMPAASAAEPDTAATTDAVDGPEAPTGPESTDPLRAAVKAPPGDLSLVNASHLWNFPETSTLVSIYAQKLDSYNVRDTTLLLEGRVIEPLNWMLADFYTETGCENLLLCAAYRTLEEQQYLWDHGMDTQGEEHTTSYIAQPGASEHHTGLALDFAIYDVYHGITYDFDGSGDSAWILEHCWEYGFIQRYPEGKSTVTGISTEPWHFRYVGQPHAYLIHQNNFCLEEYVQWLQQYPFAGQHLTAEHGGRQYEIWYCPESDIQSPPEGNYTVSGDNCGGAVITLMLP